MKKGIVCLLVSFLFLSGCSSNEQDKLKEDITALEKDVASDVQNMETITKEDIEKAVNYIHENLDKTKDSEVAKNIVKAASYIEAAAKKGGTEAKHDLLTLAQNVKTYASEIYTAAEEEKDTLIEDGKKEMESIQTKLAEERDILIEGFHKLLNQ